MPFTPSHAVIALPFLRTPLIPAAIAIGAMTPDLPLFVRSIVPSYATTHDFAWLPVTTVFALLLLLMWRCILRPGVRELSPDWLARRLPDSWDEGWRPGLGETFPSGRGILLLLVSLGIGVASHILWDLFTHEGRWGSDVLPVLDQQWGPLPGYRWLQHGSSAIGLGIIGVWVLLRLVRRRVDTPLARVVPAGVRWAWWLSLPVVLIGAWFIVLGVQGPLDDEWTIAHLAYRALPPACAVWGVFTLALCVLVQARRRSVRL